VAFDQGLLRNRRQNIRRATHRRHRLMFSTVYDAARDDHFLALVCTKTTPSPRIRIAVGWYHEVARLDPRARPARTPWSGYASHTRSIGRR
jgi:hypothetical protein